MKKYGLKQEYSSIFDDIDMGDVVYCEDDLVYFFNKKGNKTNIEIDVWESFYKDFWELIDEKEPLFVTEDGVEVFSDIDNLFAINLTYFSKTQNTLRSSRWLIDNPSYKVFFLESNADEYIWKNKRLFSYNDIEKYQSGGEGVFYDVKAIAKERSKE